MTGVALALSVLIGAIVVTACTRIPEQLLRIFTTSPEIIAEGKAYLGLLKWTFLLFMISNLLIAMLRSCLLYTSKRSLRFVHTGKYIQEPGENQA